MIGEEVTILSLILFGAIVFNTAEIVIAMYLANMAHLAVHLAGAWRIGKWSPGSVTALITFVPSLWIVWSAFSLNRLHVVATIVIAVGLVVFIAVNIIVLKRNTPRIELFIADYVERFY